MTPVGKFALKNALEEAQSRRQASKSAQNNGPRGVGEQLRGLLRFQVRLWCFGTLSERPPGGAMRVHRHGTRRWMGRFHCRSRLQILLTETDDRRHQANS